MMKNFKIGMVLLWLAIGLTSCLTTRQTNLLQSPGGGIPTFPQAKETEEYIIKPGDELAVQIRVPAASARGAAMFSIFARGGSDDNKLYSLAVTPEGVIYFPFVGDIHVAGRTILDVQQEIQNSISQTILSEDGLFVYVSLANRSFSVIGESGVGRHSIVKEKMTIYQALSQSQDIRLYGNRTRVRIIRQTLSGTVIRTFDIRSKTIVNSEFYYIQPNDVIYVEPMSRQFLGLSSFSSIISTITGFLSVATLVYVIIDKTK